MRFTNDEKIEVEELTKKVLKCLEGTHYRLAYAALNNAKRDLSGHAIIGAINNLVEVAK